jgi:penicillin-binding protein 1A
MTSAYSVFANKGVLQPATLVRRVEDRNGAVLFEAEKKPTQVVSEATAFLMASMLSDVVNAGTAYKARAEGFKLPAAGKTGTTNDFVDAWFVGFTPRLATGVWIGFDKPRTILRNGYAGDLAVPLWARFMKQATANDKPAWLKPPRGVVSAEVCRLSGKLPDGCGDDVYTEYFAADTVPSDRCDIHSARSFAGRLADLFGVGGEPPIATLEAVGTPPPPPEPPTVTAAVTEPPPPEEPKKKRGFWSRIFGRR